MAWFYNMLVNSVGETSTIYIEEAAAWATAIVSVIIVYFVIRAFVAIFSK